VQHNLKSQHQAISQSGFCSVCPKALCCSAPFDLWDSHVTSGKIKSHWHRQKRSPTRRSQRSPAHKFSALLQQLSARPLHRHTHTHWWDFNEEERLHNACSSLLPPTADLCWMLWRDCLLQELQLLLSLAHKLPAAAEDLHPQTFTLFLFSKGKAHYSGTGLPLPAMKTPFFCFTRALQRNASRHCKQIGKFSTQHSSRTEMFCAPGEITSGL